MSAWLDVNSPEPASLSCAFGNATVVVDLAGGTGDVAARPAGPDRQSTVVDSSQAMRIAGRARGLPHVRWRCGAAEQWPLADGSVDFGIACSHWGSQPAAGRAFNPGAANGPHNPGKGWPTR